MLTDADTCLVMNKIEKLKWKEFALLELFIPRKGNQKNMNILLEGDTPLVSAKKVDNGFKGFYHVGDKEIFAGNCLTLNNDGDGGAGLAYYQPCPFALDTHVTALYPKEKMSRESMLFISSCISRQSESFGHGHSINSERLKQMTVSLPIKDDKTPDYDFMEEYMRQIERKMLVRYKKYLSLREKSTQRKIVKSKFAEVKLIDLFDIMPGVRLTKQDQIPGNKPFVGSTDSNNGITAFCGNTNASEDKNVLGVNYNGSVVENFYHPYNALFSDDVKRFHLKKHIGNKYIYLYFKDCILKQQVKYQYGYKFNEQRIKKQIIMIPVTSNGTPNFTYMENYMRNKEQLLLNRYIDKRLKSFQAE